MLKTRTITRLAAVQAIFQLNATDDTADKVIEEFCSFRFKTEFDIQKGSKVDKVFFKRIVCGAHERKKNISDLMSENLKSEWKLERIDPTMHALLELGVFELSDNMEIPTKVIIDEYVSIASLFFDGPDVGFANGILDAMARRIREYKNE